MKKIQTYKLFNNSLKDKLKGKSDSELTNVLEKLSDSDRIRKIIEYKMSYDLLPDNLVVKNNLLCFNNQLTSLPDNLVVNDSLFCNQNKLPENIKKPKGVKGKFIYKVNKKQNDKKGKKK